MHNLSKTLCLCKSKTIWLLLVLKNYYDESNIITTFDAFFMIQKILR